MAGSVGALECPGFFSYKGFKRMGVESEGVRRGCLWLESSLQVSERGAALADVLKRWRAAAYQRLRVSLTLHLARRALSGCEHVLKRSMEAQGTVSSHGLLVRLDLRALLRP